MSSSLTSESRVERRRDSGGALERRLRMIVFAVLIMIFVLTGGLIYRYVQKKNDVPRSYYEFQIGIWQAEAARNRQSAAPYINLGALYTKMGQTNKAFYAFNTAEKLQKNNPVVWYYRGLLYRKIQDNKKAIASLKKAVTLAADQRRFLPLYELADIHADAKQYDKAIDYMKASIEDQPIMWNAHFKLAQLYEKVDKKEDALREYREVRKFNATHGPTLKAIKRLSAQKGN